MATLNCCPPHASWDILKAAMQNAFTSAGTDICLARRLYQIARQVGLSDVQYRPFLLGVRSQDAFVDYLPSTVESLRGTITGKGLLSEDEFNAALARVQAYCRGKIQATKPVPNNDGTVRYRYAPLDEIMQTLQPILNAEGMAVSFDVTYDNNRVFAICELSHKAGHKASKRYGVLLSAPPKASVTQGDGSSITYAKRGAICNWFNIVAGKDNDGAGDDDNDARNIGELITAEQARALEKRVKATGSNHDKFLKFAGVGDLADTATPEQVSHAYEQIAKNRYEALDAMLKRKEAGK